MLTHCLHAGQDDDGTGHGLVHACVDPWPVNCQHWGVDMVACPNTAEHVVTCHDSEELGVFALCPAHLAEYEADPDIEVRQVVTP